MELPDITGSVWYGNGSVDVTGSYKKQSLVINDSYQLSVAIAGLKRILAAIPGNWML